MKDVHQGLALDGIARGKFRGDYSSITTNRQNDLITSLVFLKGFCLDCLTPNAVGPFSVLSKEDRSFIIAYLKGKSIDITTPDKLQAWTRQHPEKCGLPENRARMQALDHKVAAATQRSTPKPSKTPAHEAEKDR